MADIRHALRIDASPEAVFPLVNEPGGLASWWAQDANVLPAGRPTVEMGFFNRQTVYRLERVESQAGRLAVWECGTGNQWQGTRLEFELSQAEGGTLLRFGHAGWKSETDYFTMCNTTWGGLMFRLKATAEGRRLGPLFLKDRLAE